MLKIEIEPRVVMPGGSIRLLVETDQDTAGATHVDIKADAVGKLRGYGYLWLSADKFERGRFRGQHEVSENSPTGLREILVLTFVSEKRNTRYFPGKDFAPSYFEVSNAVSRQKTPDELQHEAENLVGQRKKQFYSGYGEKTEANNEFQVFVFFRNCFLRWGDIVLDKIRVCRLGGMAPNDILSLIDSFFSDKFGYRGSVVGDAEQLRAQFKGSTPCIAMQFANVYAQTPKEAYQRVFSLAYDLSLLLSLDTGASPQFLAAGIIDGRGTSQWLFGLPHYRGNWIAPFVPEDYLINQQLGILNSRPAIRFYFALYHDASSETNSDSAYFRYWALLESIAQGRGFGQAINGVRKLLRNHGRQYNVDHGITVNNQKYSTEDCIDLWYARRNITAHFGAFDPSSPAQQRQKRIYQLCLNASREMQRHGHDFYLGHLQSTAMLMVRSLLRGRSVS